ncbi:DHA2 family efflux MFS transporter permease subunit [Brochothrix campestris]|uniref:Lincomycin resistance protein LmrB n=1 Tax=Brochothrix campestris FSL F6-1037 TaxID=1265861 RepID=W7CTE4_9LIST|nr:DHA2 family efflux MFS transporter permease subunit [Brochothrix campestris]EUJ39081.1 lincomycin resistance protein LmrB [Brochothrix campestris FSL F6-1037]
MQSTEKQAFNPNVMAFALMLAAFVGLFSETALNMAFTNLMVEFSISAATVQWLATGYLLVLGILVPVSALLIQWFSTRKLFIISMIFSIVGTLVAALAVNFEMLLVGRIIQALGTGLVLPLLINVLLVIYPIHKRGAVMGVMGLVIVAAPAIAPTISGLIVDGLGWNFIFYISAVLLVVNFIFGVKVIKDVSTITKPKIDVLSIILSTIGFGAIVYGFSIAGDSSMSDPMVLLSLAIGVVALVIFVIRQNKIEHPMLKMTVFKYPMFNLSLLFIIIVMMLILSSAILLPMYLKGSLLVSSAMAGLILLPGGFLNAVLSPVVGRSFDKIGPKPFIPTGFLLAAIGLFLLSNLTTSTAFWMVILFHSMVFIGITLIIMPGQTYGLNQLPPQLYPDGSAVMSTLQQVAGAVGTTFGILLMTSGQKTFAAANASATVPQMMSAGVQHAFTWLAVLAVIGFVGSLFIKTKKSN